MRIQRGRVHIAIAHRGQGFHTEEKSAPESVWKLVGNRPVKDHVKAGKKRIQQQKSAGADDHKPPPAQRHGVVVHVLQIGARQAVGLDLGGAHADLARAGKAAGSLVFGLRHGPIVRETATVSSDTKKPP